MNDDKTTDQGSKIQEKRLESLEQQLNDIDVKLELLDEVKKSEQCKLLFGDVPQMIEMKYYEDKELLKKNIEEFPKNSNKLEKCEDFKDDEGQIVEEEMNKLRGYSMQIATRFDQTPNNDNKEQEENEGFTVIFTNLSE